MTPELYLSQRKKGLEKYVYPLDVKKIDELVSHLPEVARNDARKIWMSRIGKTYEEIQNEQMEDYKSLMIPFLSDENKAIAQKCVFGILPQQVDFFAESEWKFVNGKYYIGLNDSLCHVISIFCHMYATASLIGNFNLMTIWAPSVARYLYSLQMKNPMSKLIPSDIYPKNALNYRYSEFLTCACIHFIMGHEFGHIENKDEEIIGCKNLSYQMEYKADRKGALLCYEISKIDEFRRDQYLLAPLLSLCFLKIWEKENSKTHPPVDSRIDRIVDLYEKDLNLKGDFIDSIMKDVYKLQFYFQDMKDEIEYQKKRLEKLEEKNGTKLFL